jgi:predicted Zn-dependent protease with MMP-like domain
VTVQPDVTVQPGVAVQAAVPVRRHRDRRGRGIRGPLLPLGLPAHRTRSQQFDDVVVGIADTVRLQWGEALGNTQFAVEDIPPSDPAPWERSMVPLGRCFPADLGQPARVVVYRRPVEQRAADFDDLTDIVHGVIVEQVAHLLGRSPYEIDPRFED